MPWITDSLKAIVDVLFFATLGSIYLNQMNEEFEYN